MSRFDFYEEEGSRRLARYAADLLLTELERFYGNRSFGRVSFEIPIIKGQPDRVVVTSQVSVKAADLAADDA